MGVTHRHLSFFWFGLKGQKIIQADIYKLKKAWQRPLGV